MVSPTHLQGTATQAAQDRVIVQIILGVPDRNIREQASVGILEVILLGCHRMVPPYHAPVLVVPPPLPCPEVHSRIFQSFHRNHVWYILVSFPPLHMGEVHVEVSDQYWFQPIKAMTKHRRDELNINCAIQWDITPYHLLELLPRHHM